MRLNQADIKKYPKMAHYVKINIPDVVKSPAIVHAFRRIGGIDRIVLRNALIWSHGPVVNILPLVGKYGAFTPNEKSQEIRLSKNLVEEFEASKGKRVARAGNVYLVGATLLHELTHWADDQDGIDRPNEKGEEFEIAMYGRVIV